MATTSVLGEARAPRNSGEAAAAAGWRDGFEHVLGLALSSAVVAAVVAAAALGFSRGGSEQFGLGWAALWALAFVTLLFTARVALALAKAVAPSVGRALERRRLQIDDQRFLDCARRDPRLMADIDGAMRRCEWH